MKFEELLKKMVKNKTIPFIDRIIKEDNDKSLDKIKLFFQPKNIPKSYLIFLKNVGFSGPLVYMFNGTGLSAIPSVISNTELEKKSYEESNIKPPSFRYIVLLDDNGIKYYMNLDKCNKKTGECEIQAWNPAYPPEEQPEELKNEKYQSFEEFFRAMNSELVDIIENNKEIPKDYIISTEEELKEQTKKEQLVKEEKPKSFWKKIFGK